MKTLFTTFTFCLFTFILSAQNQTPNATTATDGILTVTYSTNNMNTSTYTEHWYSIYIINSTNALVNTLAYRTANRDNSGSYLQNWWPLVGSSLNNVKLVPTTDAITGATVTSSAFSSNLKVYWGKSMSLSNIPDGNYTLKFEICECNSDGSSISTKLNYSAPFVKGPNASTPTTTINATLGFSAISISWQPKTSALTDIKLSNLYSIYPNPAKESVYVSGPDIKGVEIIGLNGAQLMYSNQQKLNISSLKKGTYLLNINTGKGLVSKKLIKN